VFKYNKQPNNINIEAIGNISGGVKKDPESVDQFLLLFAVIKKLEYIGDLITYIAEEIYRSRKT